MRTIEALFESSAPLEHKLQTELDISRIVGGAEDLSKLVVRPPIEAVADIGESKMAAIKSRR